MKYYYHRIKLFLLYILGPPYIKNMKIYKTHFDFQCKAGRWTCNRISMMCTMYVCTYIQYMVQVEVYTMCICFAECTHRGWSIRVVSWPVDIRPPFRLLWLMRPLGSQLILVRPAPTALYSTPCVAQLCWFCPLADTECCWLCILKPNENAEAANNRTGALLKDGRSGEALGHL